MANPGTLPGDLIASEAIVAFADELNVPRVYPTLATIAFMSAAEKARRDSVRTFPRALRLKLAAMAEGSSGASTIITISYRPCVQKTPS